MLPARLRGAFLFNLAIAGVALAAACGSDGGGGSGGASSSSSTSSSSSGGSSGGSSSGGSSGGSTSSSGGANDGGADADGGIPFVPIEGLDPTFGKNAGFTASNAIQGHDYLHVMARQSTGKLVVVGANNSNATNSATDFSDLVVGRFTTAGVADTTFGNSGTRIVHVGSGLNPAAAAVQTDDKVIVVGRTLEPGKNSESIILLRFTADGALDPTFGGGNGYVLDGLGRAVGVGLQTDGKILVALVLDGKISVARYSSAGVRDNTYGSGGVADAGFGTAAGLVVQSDDKAVLLGSAFDSTVSKGVTLVARFTTGGLPDTSFNTTGKVLTAAPTGVTNTARSIAIDDQGRFVVESHNATNNMLVSRFTTTGTLDGTYGTAGFITLGTLERSFVPQPSGKIVVYHREGLGNELRRYDSTGALDTTYGTSGIAGTTLPYRVFLPALFRASNGDVFVGGGGAFDAFAKDWMIVSRTTADGAVDTTTWGTSGAARTGSGASRENPLAVAIQTDGKIVVAGGIKDFWHRGFLQRYTANGLVDTSFGSANGFKEIPDPFDFQFAGFALAPSGKFLVARGMTTNDEFAVLQYNADGTTDENYGVDGIAELAAGVSSNQGPRGMTLDAAGRALLVGAVETDVGLVRFTTTGSPDTTFGGGTGWVKTSFTASATLEWLQVVAERADGKIVAAGTTDNDMVVARFESNGSPDTTFDGDGFVTFAKSQYRATALILQPDDKIIVVGVDSLTFTSRTLSIARLTSAGALDTSWNGTGLVEEPLTSGAFLDASVPAVRQADGSIIVATSKSVGPNQDMVIARYTSAGVLDATFGTAGKLTLPLSVGDDVPSALALQPDGKLVVTGRTFTETGGNDVALLRLK